MAELLLYDNKAEPLFPIEHVASKLGWLVAFLDENITTTVSKGIPANFAPLLDTILIFARARTSALHGVQHWKVCKK